MGSSGDYGNGDLDSPRADRLGGSPVGRRMPLHTLSTRLNVRLAKPFNAMPHAPHATSLAVHVHSPGIHGGHRRPRTVEAIGTANCGAECSWAVVSEVPLADTSGNLRSYRHIRVDWPPYNGFFIPHNCASC